MTALLGINVGSPADSNPAALAATGACWVRTVYRDNIPGGYRPWLTDLKNRGIECLFVGDSSPESLGNDESRWAGRMTVARSNYGDLVKLFQWGNEPDWTGMASWTMTHQRVNRLLEVARSVFPVGAYTLVAPGMVSGQASWTQGVRIDLVDAIDAHPYAKWIDTEQGRADLNWMLDRYIELGKPLWCAEYDSRTRGMSGYLRDYPGVERAAVMCWDNAQTDNEGLALGLRQNPAAMADFKAAAAGQVNQPPPQHHAVFQLGFLEWSRADASLLGQPIENERGGVLGFSVQKTSTGRLMASNLIGRGWALTFWRDSDGARFLFNNGRSEQIA